MLDVRLTKKKGTSRPTAVGVGEKSRVGNGWVEGLSKKVKKRGKTHGHGQQCGDCRGLGWGRWRRAQGRQMTTDGGLTWGGERAALLWNCAPVACVLC